MSRFVDGAIGLASEKMAFGLKIIKEIIKGGEKEEKPCYLTFITRQSPLSDFQPL